MNRCAVWEARSNKDNWNEHDLKKWLKEYCKKWCFQLEKSENGYEHWQINFSLIKKKLKTQILKECDNKFNHIEPIATANHKDEFFYALKKDTRINGPWTDKDNDIYIPRQYRNIQLKEFQKDIMNSGNIFDDRCIDMIYDPTGGIGKSTVAAIGEIMNGYIDLPPMNDFKELIALACNICMDQNIRDPKVIFVDLPRAADKCKLGGLYSAIEQMKKGKLYDCRYHYKSWWIDAPRIWVFSNTEPDLNMLSIDRWRIWTIENDKLVKYHKG